MDPNRIIENISVLIAGVGGGLATLALICLGIKAILTFHKGGGIREVFSGAGVIFVGLMFIGLAGVIVGVIRNVTTQIGG